MQTPEPIHANGKTFLVLGPTDPIGFEIRPVDSFLSGPEEAAELGAFHEGTLISRFYVPAEYAEGVAEMLAEPRPLLLLGTEEDAGRVRANLFALFPMKEEEREAWQGEEEPSEPGVQKMVPLLIGIVGRLAVERRHPESLPLELMDLFTSTLAGQESGVLDIEIRSAGL